MNPFHLKLGKLNISRAGFCAASSEQSLEQSRAQRGTPSDVCKLSLCRGKGSEIWVEGDVNSLYIYRRREAGGGPAAGAEPQGVWAGLMPGPSLCRELGPGVGGHGLVCASLI